MTELFYERLQKRLEQKSLEGTLKKHRVLASPIGPEILLQDGSNCLLFASNDYLSLCNHPRVKEASVEAIRDYGAGTAAARFISGTMDIHTRLEKALASFLDKEEALSFVSGWSANTALMPALAMPGDIIFADELNHASLIDGCRFSAKGVKTVVYRHTDMDDLSHKLREHATPGVRFILTDGVFSMEGDVAPLSVLCELADRFDCVHIVDDAHGIGVVGRTGRGSAELHSCLGRVDIITGSLGKALGGAPGGFVCGAAGVIASLRELARPLLFSNSQSPGAAGATLAALAMIDEDQSLVEKLNNNVQSFKEQCKGREIPMLASESAIVSVPVGPAHRATNLASAMFAEGIFVSAFSYPVVPEGEARLRFQISRGHTEANLTKAVDTLKFCLNKSVE